MQSAGATVSERVLGREAKKEAEGWRPNTGEDVACPGCYVNAQRGELWSLN